MVKLIDSQTLTQARTLFDMTAKMCLRDNLLHGDLHGSSSSPRIVYHSTLGLNFCITQLQAGE